jgi:hypothetical protein
MRGRKRWIAVAAMAVLSLAACSGSGGSSDESAPPVKVKQVDGTDLNQIVMTAEAVKRIGLETETVTAAPPAGGGASQTLVPYAALIYDATGQAWVYTTVGPTTYQRHTVAVARVDEDTVTLTDGPPVGTSVVTVGAAEVYGSEFLSEE